MYKWIIVGGGIQGCTTAAYLLHFKKVSKEQLLIIDPFDEPIKKWKSVTNRIGMTYLRSPSVHHLDPDPYSLKKYAKNNDYAGPFLGYYGRPRLDMFNQYCEDLFKEEGVMDCWQQGVVTSIERGIEHWNVSVNEIGRLEAENVVLAVGVNDRPHYPDWTKTLMDQQAGRVQHVFEEPVNDNAKSYAVIGGGITSAHMAKTLALRTKAQVTLIKRHPFRLKDFDSDPGWLGPKYLNRFHKTKCYSKRRQQIREARNRGSITTGIRNDLRALEQEGKLEIITNEILNAKSESNKAAVIFSDGSSITTEQLVLATGAEACVPGGDWLMELASTCNLPCAPCGFPKLNQHLEWGNGLFAAGALAELEVGPAARNIAGARKAAERITSASGG
ncbi:NAD(P)-binding domain-containing protein [Halobacillus sp. A5]|uniref:NAD(P)-binding domain-containing protein n=1 Tax=Halobacillus sp. A5 TaxID=2880263 RepID=UPI0020A6B41A|nr:FAD/NAD(P)-binding protein [Halobacillus sp. A5]MCP3026565.1 lysine N(6)-hydroxylase/L-ornithine N(5)-oxygenase family protein [Halobacillus sp. A5]